MNERVFIESIRAGAQAAAAALSNAEHLTAVNPGAAAGLAASVFNGVFNQIATAIEGGHLDDNYDDSDPA